MSTDFKNLINNISGAQYRGIQFDGNNSPVLVLFDDLITQSTLAVEFNNVSVQSVTDKLVKSRIMFNVK